MLVKPSWAASGSFVKQVVRVGSADEDVLCYAKYVARQNAAGVDVTAATIQVQANSLLFTVNGAAEVVIGTYTGNSGADNEIVYADANIASIQNLINTINGFGAGMVAAGTTFNRWRAGFGDFRPGFVIGAGDAIAAAAANALLGEDHIGLAVQADASNLAVANTRSVCLGVEGARSAWPGRHPDHFESDYTSTVAGVVTKRRHTQAARLEDQHGVVDTMAVITDINVGCTSSVTTTGTITVYDIWDQIVWQYVHDATDAWSASQEGIVDEQNPIFGPPGSPLFVEWAPGGTYADGPLQVRGYVGVA